ncbi:MAG: hypothetical protein ACFFBD_12320 [Candidatus Hodarchaeota archaeon]
MISLDMNLDFKPVCHQINTFVQEIKRRYGINLRMIESIITRRVQTGLTLILLGILCLGLGVIPKQDILTVNAAHYSSSESL